MRKKIVCVSIINDSAEFIEVERSQDGNYTLLPSYAVTNESLLAACSRADEIYVSSLFPSVQYDWEIFPKVEERYLGSLITSFIKRKRPDAKISARFQHIRDVVKAGNANVLVALQSVEKINIKPLFDLLQRDRNKVKYIYTFPTALAGAVIESEKPSTNIFLFWCKKDVSVIAIISPEGLVKIARTLPYGIPGLEEPDADHIAASDFSADVGREVMMTANYFKQKFREPSPEKMYLLGDDRLQKIFEDFPIKNLQGSTHFSLAGSVSQTIEPEKYNEYAHLLGNLFANESFNFLPVQESQERKVNSTLSAALVVLVLCIGLAGLWTVMIPSPQSRQDLTTRMQELQFDIQDLQTSIANLKPIEGRKKYYQSAFLDKKPEFISILQQIAAAMPGKIVFDNLSMTPEGGAWKCLITGKIRGQNWQERLDTLREFGKELYSFSNFDIQNINHSLGQAGMDATSISFELSLQFIPGEEKK